MNTSFCEVILPALNKINTCGCLASFFLSTFSVATADQVTVFNNTGSTIYKLYAWPSMLIPRSNDIIGTSLQAGESKVVNVENNYGDCLFTFQFDPNNPNDKKRKGIVKKQLRVNELDICKKKRYIELVRGFVRDFGDD